MGLGSADVKKVLARYHDRLMAYRDAIDDLDVYPAPDGNTGTNMSLTVRSVIESVGGADSMDEVAEALARGSLMGARGNSGVILSQIMRGLADSFRGTDEIGVRNLVEALAAASDAAYRAVQKPVEGTILTVLREAAEAARDAGTVAGQDLAGLLQAVYRRAVDALERTPDMLPVLRRAGVVDAGGAGFLLLIAALLEVVSGTEVQLPERVLRARPDLDAIEAHHPEVADLRYEVMFFLDIRDEVVDEFRESWAEVGDSIVVVGGGGMWNCHIHTEDIGPAIEAAVAVGRPHGITVTDLRDARGAHAGHASQPSFEPRPEAALAPVGVVAVVAGDGLSAVFRELGAQGVVTGGQSMNPSTEDILRVVDAVPAPRVIVLPNNNNIVPVAEQVDALTIKRVEVVPTRNVQQGIAAMFGFAFVGEDIDRTAEDMAAAASSIVTGEVTRAVRDARVDFGQVARGDWLGIADGRIVVADEDLGAALRGLVAAILPPFAELVTVYLGEGAPTSVTKSLEAWLTELYPGLVIRLVDGGQPLYPYLVAVE